MQAVEIFMYNNTTATRHCRYIVTDKCLDDYAVFISNNQHFFNAELQFIPNLECLKDSIIIKKHQYLLLVLFIRIYC
jgi:hypothetical protein